MQGAAFSLSLSRAAAEAAASPSLPVLRLTMLRGETLRLPRGSKSVRVLGGRAWLSSGIEEKVLVRCESFDCGAACRYPVLVTAIGEEELSIVVEGEAGR
jgi:hypothetical protein